MKQQVETWIEESRSADPVVRGRAAERLGACGAPACVEVLAGLLADSDMMVRLKAACELAWLGDERGIPVLVWALDQRALCFIALEALTALGAPGSLPAVRRFFRRWRLHPLERIQAAAAMHTGGDGEGTAFLEDKLASGRPEERGLALELWGRLSMPGALDRLQAVLSDPAHPHRLDAARGLGHLGDPRGLPLLDRMARQVDDAILADVAREAAQEVRERAGQADVPPARADAGRRWPP